MMYIMLLCGMYFFNSPIVGMEQISFNNPIDYSAKDMDYGISYPSDRSTHENDNFETENLSISYQKNSRLWEQINNFLTIYDIPFDEDLSNPASLIKFLSNSQLHTFAENVHLSTKNSICENKMKLLNEKNITATLKNQKYANQINYIINQTPSLIEELKMYVAMPLYSYYHSSLSDENKIFNDNERKISFKKIFCIYCLYLIPKVKIYDSNNNLYETDTILNTYSIKHAINNLNEKKSVFLNIFSYSNYLKILKENTVPDLKRFVEENKEEPSILYVEHILNTLNQLLLLNNNAANDNAIQVRDKENLNKYWQAFWNNRSDEYIKSQPQSLSLSTSQSSFSKIVRDLIDAINKLVIEYNKVRIDYPIKKESKSSSSSREDEEDLETSSNEQKTPEKSLAQPNTPHSCFYSWFFAANLGGATDKQKKE